MNDDKIARINELARLSKGRTLSPDELTEQSILRQEYRDAVRANLTTQLSGYKIIKNEPPEKSGD
jgi:uncharacterized protein YnzC (UPF0291/DUF896 family)